jgi:hypothetical protein
MNAQRIKVLGDGKLGIVEFVGNVTLISEMTNSV